jgi:hypothetical protein
VIIKGAVPLRSLGLTVLGVVWLGVLCGCGTKPSNAIKVSGLVTLDGAPVEGAKVTYYPLSGDAPPFGVTDAKGHFELCTFDIKTVKSIDGALPGEYKVTVEIPAPTGRSPIQDMEAEHTKGRAKPSAQKAKEVKVLHANYADISKTPLTQTVPPQGAVELKLTKSGT